MSGAGRGRADFGRHGLRGEDWGGADFRGSGHPRREVLALYSTGDLPWRMRWQTGRHVRRCGDCEQQVLLFRSATAQLNREAEAETLTGFEAIADWGRLEREMMGNIGVGVAAARCIDKVGRTRSVLGKGAFAAALVALFVAGWATHIPREETARVTASPLASASSTILMRMDV